MRDQKELEIADIFNDYSHLLGRLRRDQTKVVQAIKNCRTSALGGHKIECDSCEFQSMAYNSCRNRHCPKCGFIARTKWIQKRQDDLFDCQYFHTVFTLPGELRELILRNKKVSYNILFKASSEALKEVAMDKKHLGARIGLIGVLHTWSQNLLDHPHIHYLIPGGGLKNNKWINAKEDYLMPVKVLSRIYKAKILKFFEEAFYEEKLHFMGSIEYLSHYANFKELLINCSKKDFVVYSKKPFAGPAQVIKYLGNYTHRIAISNYRLVKVQDHRVYFKVRDNKRPGESKMMSLAVTEFMRRFLLHVLPKGFVRIRHFGILGNRFKRVTVDLIKKLQGIKVEVRSASLNFKEIILEVMGLDVDKCPHCKTGGLVKTNPFTSLLSTA